MVNIDRTESCLPFLKWPGGKRWLAPRLASLMQPFQSGVYFEPFLGGGAVFFALRPPNAVLSDINEELVNAYTQVRDNSSKLIRRLQRLPINRTTFNRFRHKRSRSNLSRAVSFLYLNRTAWGGIYRLNRSGVFNVPFAGGDRDLSPLWKSDLVDNASGALQTATILNVDFETTLGQARSGDLVYCDPTYTVAHDNNGFVRYNEVNFSWLDQQRLAKAAAQAASRGAAVFVSNAFHSSVISLYPRAFHLVVERHSCVSVTARNRRRVQESLFVLLPKQFPDVRLFTETAQTILVSNE